MHLSHFAGRLTKKNSVAVQIGPLHTQPFANISNEHNSNPADESRAACTAAIIITDNPCAALREAEAHRFIENWLHEVGKVVSPTHRPPLLPRYSFLLEADSTPGP